MSKNRGQQGNVRSLSEQAPNAQQATAKAMEQAVARAQLQDDVAEIQAPSVVLPPPAPLAIVPPPPFKMTVTERGIEFENPLIKLGVWEFLPVTKDGFPAAPGTRDEQVDKIRPARALVAHGAIVIEELGLTLPLAGNHVRRS